MKGLFLLLLFGISACSLRTEIQLPYVALSDSTEPTAAQPRGSPPKTVVSGRHCESRTKFPFYWQASADKALEKALKKSPGAVALENAVLTHQVRFLLVHTQLCMEVAGVPLHWKQ